MDIASIIGLIMCGILIVFGITYDHGTFIFSKLQNFFDIPSIIITIGGTFSCVLASNSMKDFISGIKSFTLALKVPRFDYPTEYRSVKYCQKRRAFGLGGICQLFGR